MQVLSLTNEFAAEMFGGAGTAVTGMLRMLASQGLNQVVIVPTRQRDIPYWENIGTNVKVLWLPRNDRYFGRLGLINSATVLNEFPQLLQKWDLIHIHAINFAPLAYTLAAGQIPLLYSVYSLLRDELDNTGEPDLIAQFAIQDDLLARCNCLHLVSHYQERQLIARSPQAFPKLVVLPLGIAELGSWQPENLKTFVYIGRLLPYKGIEELIKALVIVRRTGRSFRVSILGQGADYYEAHLANLVKQHRLGAYVKFQGWQTPEAVQASLRQSGGLIVPSRREAFGLVALEGMATGIPLIVSSAGALPELVDSSCAKVFKFGNVQELAQAITFALDHPMEMARLGIQAHQTAEKYLWHKLAGRYLAMYRQLQKD